MRYINQSIEDLQFAEQGNTLINVYQKQSDIFYTGYVYKMARDGVVINTFNDYGISDGLVYLRYVTIQSVESKSIDLQNIDIRRAIVQRDNLVNVSNQDSMHLVSNDNLAKEIVGRSYVNDQMVMIYLTSKHTYLEGFIDYMGEDDFVWTVVNKFNFESRYSLRSQFDDIDVIEFQGSELTMLSYSKSLLLSDSVPPLTHSLPNTIYPKLSEAKANDQLVEVEAKSDNNYFYIGWVQVVNEDFVGLKLIDMSGQFGGYVLLKLKKINFISMQSDYLRLIDNLVQLNQKNGGFVQPVLNDEREFDPTENLLTNILRQSLVMKRLIRIRVAGAPSSVMGRPTEIDQEKMTFNPINDTESNIEKGHYVNLADIQEVAFGYLGTYLVKQELYLRHWWQR